MTILTEPEPEGFDVTRQDDVLNSAQFYNKMEIELGSSKYQRLFSGADLGGGSRGCAPPLPPEMTCGFLIQLVFYGKKTVWFIGVEVEQETSAPPPKKILDPPLILVDDLWTITN